MLYVWVGGTTKKQKQKPMKTTLHGSEKLTKTYKKIKKTQETIQEKEKFRSKIKENKFQEEQKIYIRSKQEWTSFPKSKRCTGKETEKAYFKKGVIGEKHLNSVLIQDSSMRVTFHAKQSSN